MPLKAQIIELYYVTASQGAVSWVLARMGLAPLFQV